MLRHDKLGCMRLYLTAIPYNGLQEGVWKYFYLTGEKVGTVMQDEAVIAGITTVAAAPKPPFSPACKGLWQLIT